jgi:hypothetical protein
MFIKNLQPPISSVSSLRCRSRVTRFLTFCLFYHKSPPAGPLKNALSSSQNGQFIQMWNSSTEWPTTGSDPMVWSTPPPPTPSGNPAWGVALLWSHISTYVRCRLRPWRHVCRMQVQLVLLKDARPVDDFTVGPVGFPQRWKRCL